MWNVKNEKVLPWCAEPSLQALWGRRFSNETRFYFVSRWSSARLLLSPYSPQRFVPRVPLGPTAVPFGRGGTGIIPHSDGDALNHDCFNNEPVRIRTPWQVTKREG